MIYTTNAIEALNSKIRCAVRTRGHFPSDEAAAKLIYLALDATSTEWRRLVREWHVVKSQLAIMFEDRFPMAQQKAPGLNIPHSLDYSVAAISGRHSGETQRSTV